MRVAVTGANDYVRRALVRGLLAAGHAVTALDHRAQAPPFPDPVRFLPADVRDRELRVRFRRPEAALAEMARAR